MPSTLDVSLYQLASATLTPSQSLKVSFITLKSLVGTLIDLLIEQKISATLWVKLPPIEGWETELNQYQQIGVPKTIYRCNCSNDDLVEITDVVDQVASIQADSQIVPVQLVAGSQLKQEYFFIVLSDQLSSLIVAYQPDPVANFPQSQLLQAVLSFEQCLIQRVLEGIRGVIAVTDTTPKELLGCWEQLPVLSTSDERALLTQLLVKQVQRTEETRPPITNESKSDRSASFLLESTTPILLTPSANEQLHNNDELIKRVAQELRTPLTNIKTALKLLDSTQLKPAQRQRYMQLLNTECDRQNSLITGLLELAQVDEEPQPTVMPSVQLADILPGVVSTYQPLAQEKGIQLGYTIPVGLPSVSCLETWLRQIIINLLHNSLKFTPSGSQVKVQVTLQGEYVQLAFRDTGIGIAVSEIPKLFDSFYRGRPTLGEDTGAGLGLTIVQQLLLRCGGSISVTSTLGEGSNFKVLLPVAATPFKSNF